MKLNRNIQFYDKETWVLMLDMRYTSRITPIDSELSVSLSTPILNPIIQGLRWRIMYAHI